MSYAFSLSHGDQSTADSSFVGGTPSLPPSFELPTCMLCGAVQTFFFQVAFAQDHAWANHSIAVFECTSCANEDELIPDMLEGQLHGANVPLNFLMAYQRNFRFLVFESDDGVLRSDYDQRLCFRRIVRAARETNSIGHIGGRPDWLQEDEAPGKLADSQAVFLLQLKPGIRFETVVGAPAQMDIGLDGAPRPSAERFYQLFIGNALYLFGTSKPGDAVYAITQVR